MRLTKVGDKEMDVEMDGYDDKATACHLKHAKFEFLEGHLNG